MTTHLKDTLVLLAVGTLVALGIYYVNREKPKEGPVLVHGNLKINERELIEMNQ